jgi:hypothetical protein
VYCRADLPGTHRSEDARRGGHVCGHVVGCRSAYQCRATSEIPRKVQNFPMCVCPSWHREITHTPAQFLPAGRRPNKATRYYRREPPFSRNTSSPIVHSLSIRSYRQSSRAPVFGMLAAAKKSERSGVPAQPGLRKQMNASAGPKSRRTSAKPYASASLRHAKGKTASDEAPRNPSVKLPERKPPPPPPSAKSDAAKAASSRAHVDI